MKRELERWEEGGGAPAAIDPTRVLCWQLTPPLSCAPLPRGWGFFAPLRSGPPRHLLLSPGFAGGQEVDPLMGLALPGSAGGGGSGSVAAGDGGAEAVAALPTGLSQTERFLDTMRFNDGGRK